MTNLKKQLEMDEFCSGLTPPVEAGLYRMEYYGDDIIPLLVDLDWSPAQQGSDVEPSSDESATVMAVWHKGSDITALISEDVLDEMSINFVESGMGGEADYGEDDGQSRLDRLLEEEAERNAP